MIKSLYPSNCTWCPRKCGKNRAAGERGFCGSTNKLTIARAALHFWEEPPLSGRSGSGAIFFSHCPLKCVYCQNYRIASGQVGISATPKRLVEIYFELREQGALNINLVTATHYAPIVADSIRSAKRLGFDLPFVWNTSGYENCDSIDELSGLVDIYLADFKYTNAKTADKYSHSPDYPEVAREAISRMYKNVGDPQFDSYKGERRLTRGVLVRHLLLPGELEESKDCITLLRNNFEFADERNNSKGILLSLMNQYTPVIERNSNTAIQFPNLLEGPSNDDYEKLLCYADDLNIGFYYWQEEGAMEESFIPDFDLSGVIKGN